MDGDGPNGVKVKRGTPELEKFDDLMAALDKPMYAAAGILELLWHITGKLAKRGDIGRMSDQKIARSIGWDGKPKDLINALVKSKWIDRSAKHRLLVHDWSEHCDDSIHMALGRAGVRFADGKPPKLHRLTKEEKEYATSKLFKNSVRTPSARSSHGGGTALAQAIALPSHSPPIAKAPPNPSPPEPEAGGAGRVASGNGGLARELGREASEANRAIEVQSILSGLEINGAVMQKLVQRRDITPAKLKAEIADIRRDPKVENVAAVLVNRLS